MCEIMLMNVVLDNGTVSLMRYFGDLSDVANRILAHGAKGEIPLMDLPQAQSVSSDCKQYKLNITDSNYLELCDTFGIRSQRVSLRRIICWFMDNEKYVDFQWEPCVDVKSNEHQQVIALINDIDTKLYKLYKLIKADSILELKSVIDKIKKEIWDV